MERRRIAFDEPMSGYDQLQLARHAVHVEGLDSPNDLHPNAAYDEYLSLPKALITSADAWILEEVHERLKDEFMPGYLDVAAWAAVESALVDDDRPTLERVELVRSAERIWEQALQNQEILNHRSGREYLQEDVFSLRIALSLAYAPMIQAMIVGNVTDGIRERTFVDVLALAQLAGVQRNLAEREADVNGIGDMLGFEHECNAHLALLQMDDPRYIPLPSTARGGSGYDHHTQTHDILVVNQHWGKILKTVPVEVKSKASLNDLKRYEALIVRGKMHLAVTGLFTPDHTRQAFADFYEGHPTAKQTEMVEQVTTTVKRLLQLYQKGERYIHSSGDTTRYHDTDELAKTHPEFSLKRPHRY